MRSAVLVFVTLLSTLAHAAPAADAPGCKVEGDAFTCEWSFDSTTSPATDELRFPLPELGRAQLNVTVDFNGEYMGWVFRVFEGERVLFDHAEQFSNPQQLAGSPPVQMHVTTTHVALGDPAAPHAFGFIRGALPGSPGAQESHGSFRVRVESRDLPDGTAPRRPAATADDPHLLDEKGDAAAPALDIRSVWFDDARLGDGVFELHERVTDLTKFPPPPPSETALSTAGVWAYDYEVYFTVAKTRYFLTWQVTTDQGKLDSMRCYLHAVQDDRTSRAGPTCAIDAANSTLHATIAESAVGSPAAGEPFTDMTARTLSYAPEDGGTLRAPKTMDEANTQRYAFALGGEAVWDQLNPRLKVDEPVLVVQAQPVEPPWYRAPFSEENLPNTLQVAGAIVGSVTFLGGLLFLALRRRHTRALLARIAQAEASHADDPAEGVRALAALEAEIIAMLERGRLREDQYQLLTARIGAATRRLQHREASSP